MHLFTSVMFKIQSDLILAQRAYNRDNYYLRCAINRHGNTQKSLTTLLQAAATTEEIGRCLKELAIHISTVIFIKKAVEKGEEQKTYGLQRMNMRKCYVWGSEWWEMRTQGLR